MVAYNFQTRFADQISAGTKTQTIRAIGKRRHAREGERLQIYTGMRTKVCRKLLAPDPVCVRAEMITISRDGVHYPQGGECMTPCVLARRDGFASFQEMLDWFERTHGLPFTGILIKWRPDERTLQISRSVARITP